MQSPEPSSVGSTLGASAASSRACQNCVKAKAKCMAQPGHPGECARCFRLKKECIVLPKTTRKRRSPNTARNTVQLEQKIESLVKLLSTAQGTVLPSRPSDKPTTPTSLSQEIQQDDVRRTDHQPAFSWQVDPPALSAKSQPSWDAMGCGRQHPVTLTPCSSTTPASNSESISAPSIDLPVSNPDDLMKIYREFYESEFPFVIVAPNITSQELKATRPWVAITINMVASHGNRTQQLALAKHILMEISAALFIRSEKSLDMLEGLIIFNVWQYYYAPSLPQHQTSAVTTLALGVLFDLGLNKPLRESEGGPDIIADTFSLGTENAKELRRSSRERRAFLCCFILSSTSGCYIKKIDSLEHTTYLNRTCESLLEAAEYESDFLLVFTARCQALSGFVSRKFLNSAQVSDEIKAPVPMHSKAVKADLDNFFKALPTTLQQHTLARRSYHSLEVFIYELSLHRSLFPTNLNAQRLDMMYACLTSAKEWLNNIYALPLSSYYSMSILTLAQLGHVLATMFKLSFIDVPGWDLAHVRSTVNLPEYFEHFISKFEHVGALIDNSQRPLVKRSFPTGCSLAMTRVKGWYENRIAAAKETTQQEEQTGLAGMEDFFNGENFNYFDDAFMGDWQDFAGDFMQQ